MGNRSYIWAGLVLSLWAVNAGAQSDIDFAHGGYDAVWHGTSTNAFAGTWLDAADVSRGDDRRDFVIGSPGSAAVAGAVYIHFGGPSPSGDVSLASADVIITGGVGESFGYRTASGNVFAPDGSTRRDLVVSAPNAFGNRGAVYVFRGGFANGARLGTSQATLTVIGRTGDLLGYSLATADLNGDSYRDILIGLGRGGVYVIFGGTAATGTRDLMIAPPDITITGNGIGHVLAAGEVSGDLYSDVVFGAGNGDIVYLLKGRPGGFASTVDLMTAADAVFPAADVADRAGDAVVISDLDSDGVKEIIIGAPGGDGPGNTRPSSGEVYVMWGGPGIATRNLGDADLTFYGAGEGWRLGVHLSTGSINRDDPDDLIMLAPGAVGGAGELDVYYGRRRSQFGTVLSNGRRAVDFGLVGQYSRRIFGNPAFGPIRVSQVFEVTGEGASDILAAIPSMNGNAGGVLFTMSPKLRPAPKILNLTAAEGAGTTSQVEVGNPSALWTTWQATPAAPWLSASPASGTSVASSTGTFIVTASAAALVVGTYTGTVDVRSTTVHLDMVQRVTVNLTVTQARFAAIESPAPNATVNQPLTVRGWAIDKGMPSGTGVASVQLTALRAGTGLATPLGTAVYGGARASVETAHGTRYRNSGFELTYSGTLTGGSYRIVATVTNTAGQTWTTPAGEVVVNVNGPAGPAPADFNHDGRADLLFQHGTSGALTAWMMNGTTRVQAQALTPNAVADPNWKVVAMADFNRDDNVDLLWQHRTNGGLVAWLMNGTSLIRGEWLSPTSVPDTDWKVVGAGDFNNDSRPDLLWQHQIDGGLVVWLMNGTALVKGEWLSPRSVPDTNWRVAAVADFDLNGSADLLWQHRTSGGLVVWFMAGTAMRQGQWLSPTAASDTSWQVKGAADLNSDGAVDLIWQHNTSGGLVAWLMSGLSMVRGVWLTPEFSPDANTRLVAIH